MGLHGGLHIRLHAVHAGARQHGGAGQQPTGQSTGSASCCHVPVVVRGLVLPVLVVALGDTAPQGSAAGRLRRSLVVATRPFPGLGRTSMRAGSWTGWPWAACWATECRQAPEGVACPGCHATWGCHRWRFGVSGTQASLRAAHWIIVRRRQPPLAPGATLVV